MIQERLDEVAVTLDTTNIADESNTFWWWQMWRASNYVSYPFSGALVDQPIYVINDFTAYDLLDEYVNLEAELVDVQKQLAKGG